MPRPFQGNTAILYARIRPENLSFAQSEAKKEGTMSAYMNKLLERERTRREKRSKKERK